jgi:hypothetical protein
MLARSTLRQDLADRWAARDFPIQVEERDDWPQEYLDALTATDAPGGKTEAWVTDMCGPPEAPQADEEQP